MKEIKLFKLVTSEEVVTTVIEETDEYFVLEKPRLCAMQQEQDAEGKITGNYLVLMPWMVYATDPVAKTERDVKMYKATIAGEAVEVPLIMEKEYQSQTSPIQLA